MRYRKKYFPSPTLPTEYYYRRILFSPSNFCKTRTVGYNYSTSRMRSTQRTNIVWLFVLCSIHMIEPRNKRAIIIASFLLGFLLGTWWILWFINSQRFVPQDYLEWATISTGDTTSALLEEVVQEALSWNHKAARDEERYYQRLDLICRSHPKLCNTVSLAWDFSLEDSFFYKSIAIFVIARLDNYYDRGSLSDTINAMSITDKWWRRWVAWRTQLTINTSSINTYKEFLEIGVHELGHIIDLWLIQWSSNSYHPHYTEFGRKVFSLDDPSLFFYQLSRDSEQIRKWGVDKYDFCSGYGQTNPFEDFSECFNLYMNHNSLFRELASKNSILKQKYNTIADFFNGKYLYDNKENLKLIVPGQTFFVFDTTKI